MHTERRNTKKQRAMAPRAGDPLPDVTVSEDEPGNKFSIRDVFTGKKGVLVGVPGAFTPGCSQQHLPTYVEQYEGLKEAGADVIACISVNDPFVMRAWGESSGAKGKVRDVGDLSGGCERIVLQACAFPHWAQVRMIADFKGELVSAMGVELDMGGKLALPLLLMVWWEREGSVYEAFSSSSRHPWGHEE